ncbi:hypothetical protein ACBR40_45810 [Nonomuraea sp. AD125B]|uniref:hypothetical protein n=1 Tax=Nonomuraea sp. AD125B TaxID=3242897 RepID=UPI0035293A32
MPENPPDATPASLCVAALVALRQKAGNPSYGDLVRLSGRPPRLTKTTVQNVLTGARKNPPRWTWAADFFTACQQYVKKTGLDPDAVLGTKMDWHQYYMSLLQAPGAAPPAPAPNSTHPSTVPERVPGPGDGRPNRPAPIAAPTIIPEASHDTPPGASPPQPPGRAGAGAVVSVAVSPLETLTMPAAAAPPPLADLISPYDDVPSSGWTVPAWPEVPSPAMATDDWPSAAAQFPPYEPASWIPAYNPPAPPPAPPFVPPRTPPQLELPQPVEQEATYAALNAIGEKKSLSHERMRAWFGPRGALLLEKAEVEPLAVAPSGKASYALANLELGILLVNRNACQEGQRFLERARDALPTIAIDLTPRPGDYFVGTIPQEICRQVADGYGKAGRQDNAERWLRYGETLLADMPIGLTVVATGKHNRQAGTIQHYPLSNAAEIRQRYWTSILKITPDADPEPTSSAAAPRRDPAASRQARQGPGSTDGTRFTTREAAILNAMLASPS